MSKWNSLLAIFIGGVGCLDTDLQLSLSSLQDQMGIMLSTTEGMDCTVGWHSRTKDTSRYMTKGGLWVNQVTEPVVLCKMLEEPG